MIKCTLAFSQGYNHPSAYIAAQGPMPNTFSDFWRMIWEHRLVTVVMLTKCTEAGKVPIFVTCFIVTRSHCVGFHCDMLSVYIVN